jgi:addiction module RelE/StbE family toxin
LNVLKIIWTETAFNDLTGIIRFIERDGKEIAKNIYLRIKKKVSSLDKMPLQGRIVPELEEHGLKIYREIIENPWRIIYKTEGQTVYILAVIDGRRDIDEILSERLL